jgi:hypothetical protein
MTREIPASAPLVSVCSEIGRGHPAYLDSVLAAMEQQRLGALPPGVCYGVQDLCLGTSATAWRYAETAYRFGGMGEFAAWLYNRLRPASSVPSALALNILGSDLRRVFTGYPGICLVDHPILARILAPVCRVAYVHGEISAPRVAAVPNCFRIFVPLESTRQKLLAVGCEPSAVLVTGLIIEPALVATAEAAFKARIERLRGDAPLTVGFFLSGARPKPHVERILAGAVAVTRAGHRAIVFWGTGWLRAAKAQAALRRNGVSDESVQIVWARTRAADSARAAELVPSLDVMVAAAHERTNWALGLGLPLFALLPHIGPFARENFELAERTGVCLPLREHEDSLRLDDTLAELRKSGRLAAMAEAGWGRLPIDGAATAARDLLSFA